MNNDDSHQNSVDTLLRTVSNDITIEVAARLDTDALLAEVHHQATRQIDLDRNDYLATDFADDTFWGMLDTTERAQIWRVGIVGRFSPGENLSLQGDELRYVFVLLEGHVEVIVNDGDRELVCAVRGAGDILGELAAVDDHPRSATIRARDEVIALFLSKQGFTALCHQRPMTTWTVLRTVVGRLRELGQQAAEYRRTTPAERVGAFLVELADRHGIRTSAGVTIPFSPTSTELLERVNESSASVEEVLRDLRDDGLITTTPNQVTILDLDRLRESSSEHSAVPRTGSQRMVGNSIHLALIS